MSTMAELTATSPIDVVYDSDSMEEEGKWEQGSPSHDRVCSFCGATQTPMWRRGPGGKTVLCNACGVKFAIRRRSSGAASAAEIGSNSADEEQEIDIPSTTGKRGRFSRSGRTSTADLSKERYYCKYCNMSWDVNYFRNRQQWGAHCSNCSRKRKLKDAGLGVPVEGSDQDAPAAQPSAPKKPKTYGNSTFSEDQYDSDSETVIASNNAGLNKLLTAVESVLNEEREIDAIRAQVQSLRSDVLDADRTGAQTIAASAPALEVDIAHRTTSAFTTKVPLASGEALVAPSTDSLQTLRKLTAPGTDQQQPLQQSVATPSSVHISPAPGSDSAQLFVPGFVQAQQVATTNINALRAHLQALIEHSKSQVTQTLQSIQAEYTTLRAKQQRIADVKPVEAAQVSQFNSEVNMLARRVQSASLGFTTLFGDLSTSIASQIEEAKHKMVLQFSQHQSEFERQLYDEYGKFMHTLSQLDSQLKSQLSDVSVKLTVIESALRSAAE